MYFYYDTGPFLICFRNSRNISGFGPEGRLQGLKVGREDGAAADLCCNSFSLEKLNWNLDSMVYGKWEGGGGHVSYDLF